MLLLPGGRHESHGEDQDMLAGWQGDAAHNPVSVEIERVSVEMKRTIVLGAIALQAIGHDRSFGLTLVTARLIPVAEALGDRRGCAIDVRNRKHLQLLAAFNTRCENLEAGELAFRQGNRFARDHVRPSRNSSSNCANTTATASPLSKQPARCPITSRWATKSSAASSGPTAR